MARGWLLCVATLALGAAHFPLNACAETPPVQKVGYYAAMRGKALEEKIAPGNADVRDRALQSNLEYGQDVKPEAPAPDHPLIPKVRAALRNLPPAIQKLAAQYVMAVWLLEDDWGTATTEGVKDEQGAWRYSYVTLNLTALTRNANAWTEWKENSAFRPDPKYALRMTIEAPEGDTEENAIAFIFLHELGHVIGLGLKVHGFWDDEGISPITRDSKFETISWRPDEKAGEMVSRWGERFPRLQHVKYYRFDKAPTPLADAETVYRALAQTDFPSLYGATNLYDDFAESFVIYVHTRMLNRPYRVEVYEGATKRFTYTSCIVSGTCPQKVQALEAILGLK